MTAPSIVEFLHARLGEKAHLARSALLGYDLDMHAAAGTPEPPTPDVRWRSEYQHVTKSGVMSWQGTAHVEEPVAEVANYPAAEHIALHDPAAVLRDIEAKRRIISEHRPWPEPSGYRGEPDPMCSTCVSMVMDEDEGGSRFRDLEHEPWPCPTVRLLALPDNQHPDYQPEWAP